MLRSAQSGVENIMLQDEEMRGVRQFVAQSDIFEKQLLNELCKYAILKNVETDKIVLEIRREIKFINTA